LVCASSVDKLKLHNLLRQVDFYLTSGNFEKAADLRDQALVLFKKIGAENDESTFSGLHMISHTYSERKMYNDAIKTESVLVEVFPLAIPNNKKDYALYLNDLAFYSLQAGDFERGMQSVNKAIKCLENTDNDEALAIIYIRTAELLSESDSTKLDTAILYQATAVDIYKKIYGNESNKTLDEVQYLVKYYEKANKFQKACSLAKEIWDIKYNHEKESSENILYYKNYVRLSDLCNDTLTVINNIHPLDSLTKQIYGEFSDEYIESLLENAEYLQHYRLYSQSGDNVIRMLHVADSLHNNSLKPYYDYAYHFATNLQLLHQHRISATILKTIIDRSNDFTFDNKELVIASKIAYAHSLSRIGELSTSLLILNQIEEDAIKLYGNKSCAYAKLLARKAYCCEQLNDLENAIKFGEIAADIEKEIEHQLHYADQLTWLAGYYNKNNQVEKALQCDLTNLSIYKELYGEQSSQVINTYSNIISLNLDDNICNKYDVDLKKIISCVFEYIGNNPKDEVLSPHFFINNLAISYGRSSDAKHKEMSQQLFHKALEIAKNRYGKDSEDYIKILENYSFECLLQEDPNISNSLYDLIRLKKEKLLKVIPYIDSSNREKLWQEESFWFQNFVSLCLSMIPSDTLSAIAYDANLFSKGFLLGTEIEIGRLIKEEGDSIIQFAYNNLIAKRKRLENLQLSDVRKSICDSLENEINKDELKMLSLSKQYSSYMSNFKTTWQDIRNKLTPADVAIEFEVLYHSNDSTEYIALVLKHDYAFPKMVHLFWDDGNNFGESCKTIWNSLDSEIRDCRNIYFSAVNKLHTTPIEYYDYNGGIINSVINIYRLSSTRQLLNDKEISNLSQTVVYGGLKYDMQMDDLERDSKQYSNNTRSYTVENIVIDSLDYRAGWKYLPGTLVEADSVNNIFRESTLKTSLYTERIGTEASFKNLDGKRNSIIHIATHGFYYTNSESNKIRKSGLSYVSYNRTISNQSQEETSLIRSGLLLAGCSNILKGEKPPTGVDDGILLSKEIVNLDLRGLELVTLSACDTGLGDVTGEGVFGLQRAFKKAGAKSILMSLWKVDDNATRLFMVEFYKNYVLKKMSKTESLKVSQEFLRNYKEVISGERIYNDVSYWGAFVILDAI
jgi:hypothetical protein